MADELQVDPKILRQAADGIDGVIEELQQIGMSEEAMAGRGFDSLKLPGLKVGTDGLKSAFDGFCDKWEWGVRALIQDANTIARDLGLAAGSYHMEDEYFSGVLKIAAVDAGRCFGRRWASSLDERIEIDRAGAILVGADGEIVTYPHGPVGSPSRPAHHAAAKPLTRMEHGGYRLDDPVRA